MRALPSERCFESQSNFWCHEHGHGNSAEESETEQNNIDNNIKAGGDVTNKTNITKTEKENNKKNCEKVNI